MSDTRDEGLRIFRELLPGKIPDGDIKLTDGRIGEELGELSLIDVFGMLWSRPGLSRRDRSLVTLGILIALRAESELREHFPIARTNGLTDTEIAEVIYHSAGYTGFPAAAAARKVAVEVLPPQEPTNNPAKPAQADT